MYSNAILIFALVVYAYGDQPPPPPPPPPPLPPPPPAPIPPYAYNYAVLDAESGNDFSAEQEAKHRSVAGQYKVLRADGKIMTVSYTAKGDSGFVAEVVTELPPPAYGAPPAPFLYNMMK
ncbi:cuticle protein 8-like [Lepeophtheirus salmonis]|uniref:cuticle protein 8-like n=1 Tax=Lepeophtheirus salmonis TaxID=72036 RepID=UPI001AEB39EB|nr:protein enabled homolog [Lepeophtheirus salmonis]